VETMEMTADKLMEVIQNKHTSDLPDGWWNWGAAKTAHVSLARQFIDDIAEYPDQYLGKGIVICAGGHRLFTNAYVCVRMLRHLGCRLPIQFWHLKSEIDDQMRNLVAPLGVACIDASEVDQQNERQCRFLSGWELKPFAILNCPYEEVILLDSDNVAVVDPTFLFATPEYVRTGAIFWPDYGRLESFRDIWAICEVPYRDEPEFESGQIVVDKRRCWRALQLTMHYNEHSDFYYRHIHGDKDTYHMAFHRTGTEYEMPSTLIHSLDATMCQHDFTGQRIFQHRNMDKWRFDGTNREIGDFWFEDVCSYFLSELRERWSGRVYGEMPKDDASRAVFAQAADSIYRYERVGYDVRELELMRDGTVGRGADACEQCWTINRRNGDFILTILGENEPTCHLTWDGQSWNGRWLRHEQMPVELTEIQDWSFEDNGSQE